VVFFCGVMSQSYSPLIILHIPKKYTLFISDNQPIFDYLETGNPRHEPRRPGGLADNL
jgi:hypothetical protein